MGTNDTNDAIITILTTAFFLKKSPLNLIVFFSMSNGLGK